MAEAKKVADKKAVDETRDQVTEAREANVDLPQDATHAQVEKKTGDVTPEQTGNVDTKEETTEAGTAETGADDEKAEAKIAKAGKRSAKAIREEEAEEARQAAKEERKAHEADEAPKPPRRQMPNPLHQHGKKYRAAKEKIEKGKLYGLADALKLAAETATTKFDSSVEIHVNLGVDPRQADQTVRATVVLPNGTGKTIRIAVFADGKAADDAKAAGADLVGTDALIKDIEAGKLDFDKLIATPAGMANLGKVAKVLGPRGLMPNPKSGTVTPDVAKAVTEAKAGKVEFRIDKQAIIHQAVGKVSFDEAKLAENAQAFLSAVLKAKPAAAKGSYVKGIAITTSMGPSVKVDAPATISALSTGKK